MYMVISKPKRMSQAAGVCQAMMNLLLEVGIDVSPCRAGGTVVMTFRKERLLQVQIAFAGIDMHQGNLGIGLMIFMRPGAEPVFGHGSNAW
jgi:hypothetical protein